MTKLHAFRKTVAILAIALGVAGAACLLPENPYQRWQLLDGTIHARASWMYERIHYDPTPIDVVFVGPSRIGAGVDAPRLTKALAARGLPSNVVNFSLPEAGRDINAAIVDELLSRKTPKLLVIGVTEKPSRFGHSTFKYLAPREMIVEPGYIANAHYLGNLVYLPFRQMRLFMADLAPGAMGLRKTFDPSHYRGATIDTTGSVVLPDGSIKNGDEPASFAELDRGVRKLEAGMTPPILPADYADIEFGDERHYIRQIAEKARARGVRVAFLFLPYYTGPSKVQEQRFYETYGPVWNAGFLSQDAELYSDYGHLTRWGADKLTDWVTDPVSTMLATPEAAK
jgi:hypothetical protein